MQNSYFDGKKYDEKVKKSPLDVLIFFPHQCNNVFPVSLNTLFSLVGANYFILKQLSFENPDNRRKESEVGVCRDPRSTSKGRLTGQLCRELR